MPDRLMFAASLALVIALAAAAGGPAAAQITSGASGLQSSEGVANPPPRRGFGFGNSEPQRPALPHDHDGRHDAFRPPAPGAGQVRTDAPK